MPLHGGSAMRLRGRPCLGVVSRRRTAPHTATTRYGHKRKLSWAGLAALRAAAHDKGGAPRRRTRQGRRSAPPHTTRAALRAATQLPHCSWHRTTPVAYKPALDPNETASTCRYGRASRRLCSRGLCACVAVRWRGLCDCGGEACVRVSRRAGVREHLPRLRVGAPHPRCAVTRIDSR